MENLDTGIYGAKVQSWRAANPRDLLKRVIEENPGADDPALLALLNERLLEDREYQEAVNEYWFTNNRRSLMQPQSQTVETKAAIAASAETIKGKIKERIQEEAKLILLDMTMPNGRPLRDCTGKDCAKAGGWLTKIAAKVKPNQKVGAVLSEKKVRAIFETK